MRDLFARIFLPKHVESLNKGIDEFNAARASSEGLKREYDALKEEYKLKLESIDIVDVFRERMKGFKMSLLDDHGGILDAKDLVDADGVESFLSKAHDVANNEAFSRVLEYLQRNQVQFVAMEGKTLEEINFARATFNAIALIQEEFGRLSAVHKERNAPKEEYDTHEVV